jgi:hypothetical protein
MLCFFGIVLDSVFPPDDVCGFVPQARRGSLNVPSPGLVIIVVSAKTLNIYLPPAKPSSIWLLVTSCLNV